MLNRILVLEALFSFAIVTFFCFFSSPAVAGPGEGLHPHIPQFRVIFDDPPNTQYQHRPVIVKKAEHGKTCHKCQPKNEAQLNPKGDPKGDPKADARDQILQRHMEQCQKANLARRLEERRRELEMEQITPVTVRR